MSVSNLRPLQKIQPYLTIVPGRRPREKTHTNIGNAKNAVRMHTSMWGSGNHGGAALYEWNGETEDWTLLYEIPAGESPHRYPWEEDRL